MLRQSSVLTAKQPAGASGAAGKAVGMGSHLVHVFPSFGWGGVPIRIASIVNNLGRQYRHTILALDGNCAAQSRLDNDLDVDCRAISRQAAPFPFNLPALCRKIDALQPDLLLTYNWGAIEWAMANSFWPGCRHFHLESGFGTEEANRQIPRRVWFRKLALRRCERLIVPSRTLVELATRVWKVSPDKITYIPNGVDCSRFGAPPVAGSIPGFTAADGETIIGTVAPLRPEKNLKRLIRAFAGLDKGLDARLVIVGDGPELESLEVLAKTLNVADRIVFAGHVENVEEVLGWFDVFAISSDTEQMPNALVQAMAAALPVVGTDVGDVKSILAPANRAHVAAKGDDASFRALLEELIRDPEARNRIGRQNQAHARAHYAQEQMFSAYESLFEARHG